MQDCCFILFIPFFHSSGIGHMVGAGIFVLTGTVAKDIAGPGVVLSYLFAGVSALLSSLCYAEFGAKVPKVSIAVLIVPQCESFNPR